MFMKLGFIAGVLVGFVAVSCGTPTRNFGSNSGGNAGAGGRDQANNAGSAHSSGHTGVGGDTAPADNGGSAGTLSGAGSTGVLGEAGSSAALGEAGTDSSAGAAGEAGAGGGAPSDPCLALSCSGATPKCKVSGTSAQCVACVVSADCSNGTTCSPANTCTCTARFNGKNCEYQVFRAVGTLPGDASSDVTNISHDGGVVVGNSVTPNGLIHAYRYLDGGAMQYMARPAAATGATYCSPTAVDSANNALLMCDDGELFLYSTGGVATSVPWPTNARLIADISLDGKVIVGGTGSDQAVRRANSTNTLLGPLQPGGSSWFYATNGDGSVAVGTQGNTVPMRWSASAGMTALTIDPTWANAAATDVSTDGKVIVGWASKDWELLSGQVAVKWSGASLTPMALSAASATSAVARGVSADGSVIVGSQGADAMVWDSAGGHTVKSLVGMTPDLTADWTLDRAVAVSDDGKVVVGIGTHQTHSEAWIVHLP
jgi:uncharacterized membrane protein